MKIRFLSRLLVPAVVAGLFVTSLPALRADDARPEAKALLGVMVGATDKDAAKAGCLVQDVTADSPAAKAGLKKGDVILWCGKTECKEPMNLVNCVAGCTPGDKVTITYLRDGKEEKCEVALGERRVAKSELPKILQERNRAFLGVWAQELTAELKKDLGVNCDKGVVVHQVMPNSPAAKAGLQEKDVITRVEAQDVANPNDLVAALRQTGPGKECKLTVIRGKDTKELKVQLQASPMGLGLLRDFDKDFPHEKFPGLDQELKRKLQEMRRLFRELEDQGSDSNPSE